MSRRVTLVFGLLAGLATPASVQAQAKGDKVRITTIDAVDLHATFYPARKGKSPPTVLMLHPLGENSSKKDWVRLAETLSEKSAVLTFDFRGHGQSTEVLPETFWKYTFNKQNIKGANINKSSIEFKEFEKAYYSALINDIAACKAFLDRKNDTGACNTSSFIVVGADTGASLGAIWVASEWYRHRLVQNPMNLVMMPDTRPEGMDIIAGVWLSISPQLGTRTLSLSSILDVPLRQRATPMVFLYSDADKKSQTLTNSLLKFRTAKEKAKYALTDRVEIPNAGNLTGTGLLQKSLGVDSNIQKYLDDVVDAKGREWTEREFRKTQYIWRTTPSLAGPVIHLKQLNDTNLMFDTYTRFMK
jgi:alpha-beta hydrolase superfamily lysophospholipase